MKYTTYHVSLRKEPKCKKKKISHTTSNPSPDGTQQPMTPRLRGYPVVWSLVRRPRGKARPGRPALAQCTWRRGPRLGGCAWLPLPGRALVQAHACMDACTVQMRQRKRSMELQWQCRCRRGRHEPRAQLPHAFDRAAAEVRLRTPPSL